MRIVAHSAKRTRKWAEEWKRMKLNGVYLDGSGGGGGGE